ncbi:MAG: hypothetical protein ACUVUS_05105 [Thermoproteota archaeon]
MALSYVLYGIYASLLVHWYFNYYLYTNRLIAFLQPNLSFLGLFSFRIIPTYHPATVLYNPKVSGVMLDDWKQIGEIVKSLK